jgi:hypothetical protein
VFKSAKSVTAAIGFLSLASTILAQTTTSSPTPRSQSATVSGRVFLITKSGDLKPARMALVYVFFMGTAGETAAEEKARGDGDTVGLEWLKYASAASREDTEFVNAERDKAMANIRSYSSEAWDRRICTHDLVTRRAAIRKTLDWAKSNNKMSQVLQTQTDEEGTFELVIPSANPIIPMSSASAQSPGEWRFLADGQAGANTAFWENDNTLAVEPGASYKVKMPSPFMACLNTE